MTTMATNGIEKFVNSKHFAGDRETRVAALEMRVAQSDKEERKMIIAKDAVLRKAEELRRREESLDIREAEIRMRLSILEKRVQDLLAREAAIAIVSRNLGRA